MGGVGPSALRSVRPRDRVTQRSRLRHWRKVREQVRPGLPPLRPHGFQRHHADFRRACASVKEVPEESLRLRPRQVRVEGPGAPGDGPRPVWRRRPQRADLRGDGGHRLGPDRVGGGLRHRRQQVSSSVFPGMRWSLGNDSSSQASWELGHKAALYYCNLLLQVVRVHRVPAGTQLPQFALHGGLPVRGGRLCHDAQ